MKRLDEIREQAERDESVGHGSYDMPKVLNALYASLALHYERTDEAINMGGPWCNECADDFPCPTVRAITEALDGTS